jgi:hypothetical protein
MVIFKKKVVLCSLTNKPETMRTLNLTLIVFFTLLIFGCRRNDDDVILNKVPVANAGPSQNVTLPSPLNLTGSGTDMDGHIVAYLWSQVAGPNTPVIADPGAANTVVTGIIPGSYIFQLMVTDNDGATGVDTMTVKVNPAPQTVLTLQPSNNSTDFILALVNGSSASSNGYLETGAVAWTSGGNPVTERSLLRFDLSSIPQTATIVSANLYLYSYPPPVPDGNLTDANFGTDNSMIVQRVTSNWSLATTTWFNQPSGTTQNQVIVPHTSLSILDLNLDVTSLISDMVTTNSNYGFMMKLQNETPYTSRMFVSSHSTLSSSKYPKLVIVYQ